MKNKNLKIALIILFITSIVSFSIAFFIYRNAKLFVAGVDYSSTSSKTEEFDITDISNIKINNNYANISVSTYTGNKAILEYSFDNKDTKAYINGDTFYINQDITYKNRPFLFFNPPARHGKIELKIPEVYIGSISIESDSGNINLNGNFENTYLSADAGSINFVGNSNYIDMQTDAGNVNFVGSAVDGINLKADVGTVNVKLTELESGKYNIESDVGAINLSLPQEANFSILASGDIGLINNSYKFDDIISAGEKFEAGKREGRARVEVKTDVGSINIE